MQVWYKILFEDKSVFKFKVHCTSTGKQTYCYRLTPFKAQSLSTPVPGVSGSVADSKAQHGGVRNILSNAAYPVGTMELKVTGIAYIGV